MFHLKEVKEASVKEVFYSLHILSEFEIYDINT